jgi:pyruvate formate lyase activating enzyme
MVVRTPVVPGINDDREGMRAIGRFIRDELGESVVQYQLLPYRKMGTEKYATLNRPYPMEGYEAPEREAWEANLLALTDMLRTEFGIPAAAGSAQKLF